MSDFVHSALAAYEAIQARKSAPIRYAADRDDDGQDDDESGKGWRKIGGGAPALIDFETGSILAGCPGLEDENLDDITDESIESRERRERKQEIAEQHGHESKEVQRARQAWEDARQQVDDYNKIVLLRLGDKVYSFGEDADILKYAIDVGDGQKAEFEAGALDQYIEQLVEAGHQIAVASRNEHGEARINRTEGGESADPWAFQPKTKLEKEIVAYVGDNPRDVNAMKEIAAEVWDRKRREVADRNYSLRNLLGQFGIEGHRQGAFIRQVQKLQDPDKIRRFDEMVEMAVRDHPELLEYETGDFAGRGDAEYALFNRLQRGLEPEPAKWSDEVLGEAAEYFRWSTQSTGDWEPVDEGESIPFARRHSPVWRNWRGEIVG